MVEDIKEISRQGCVMANFFLNQLPLKDELEVETIEIIFPEDRISDVVKLKNGATIKFWSGTQLLVDGLFSKLSTTHRVGHYQIKLSKHICKVGDQLYLCLAFPMPPTLSNNMSALARIS